MPDELYHKENILTDFFAKNENLYSGDFKKLFEGINTDLCKYLKSQKICENFAGGILKKGAH